MNNLLRSQYLLRFLQNEIHNCNIARRTVQTSSSLRDTKSKQNNDKPEANDDKSGSSESTKPSAASGSAPKSNLFGALSGMRALNDRTLSEPRMPVTKQQKAEMKSELKSEIREFKTAEALKTAMEQAAKVVSESLPDKEQTESDLVQQMRRYDEAKAAGERGDVDGISALLTGMKVEDKAKTVKPETHQWGQPQSQKAETRHERGAKRSDHQNRGEMWGQDSMPDRRQQKSQMEGFLSRSNKRLGIFSHPEDIEQDADEVQRVEPMTKTIWSVYQENELRDLMKGQHRHGFDEMLEWTQQGKVWRYPINNEQGLEEEQAIGFHEHVLLDNLIEDFPKTGPIRDFMELVIIGLSKNPYFTVKQKHEHIDWFRQYFSNKEEVLREAKALPEDFHFESTG